MNVRILKRYLVRIKVIPISARISDLAAGYRYTSDILNIYRWNLIIFRLSFDFELSRWSQQPVEFSPPTALPSPYVPECMSVVSLSGAAMTADRFFGAWRLPSDHDILWMQPRQMADNFFGFDTGLGVSSPALILNLRLVLTGSGPPAVVSSGDTSARAPQHTFLHQHLFHTSNLPVCAVEKIRDACLRCSLSAPPVCVLIIFPASKIGVGCARYRPMPLLRWRTSTSQSTYSRLSLRGPQRLFRDSARFIKHTMTERYRIS